jgi:hypothetical protein
MPQECVVQHPDDRAERDYGHQQKRPDEFIDQKHGGPSFILISRLRLAAPQFLAGDPLRVLEVSEL